MTSTAESPKSRMSVKKQVLSGIFGIFIIFLIFYFSGVSGHSVVDKIVHINVYFLVGVFVCTALTFALTASKWKSIVKDMISLENYPKGYFFYYASLGAASGYLVSQNTGILGVRSLSLRLSHEVPLRKGVYSVLLDQLFDWMILILFLVPSFLFLSKTISLYLSLMISAAITTLFLIIFEKQHLKLLNLIIKLYQLALILISKLPILKKRFSGSLSNAEYDYHISKKTAMKLFLYSLVRFLVITGRSYFTALALNLDISFPLLLLCIPLAQLMSVLIEFIPGSFVVAELGWYGVLTLGGINSSEAISFLACQKASGVLSVFIVTLLSYLFYTLMSSLQFKSVLGQSSK